MGVHGLWRLLDSFGQVSQPENWRGRRVAIDASIWMAQFRAQTGPGQNFEQQIIEGFFLRILKLLFYGIQPVFVFDGPATSAKSAERHRRQLRRNALTQVLLKRRAQQIMQAQVAAGVLDIAHLPKKTCDADGRKEEESNPNGKKMLVENTEGQQTEHEAVVATKEENDEGGEDEDTELPCEEQRRRAALTARLQRNCRRGVQRARRTTPAKVSAKLTSLFLNDAAEFISERKKGEKVLVTNTLRYTTPSLFMGPRNVFADEGDADTSGTHATQEVRRHAKTTSDVVAITVEGESCEDADGDGADDDVASDDLVTVPSSEVSVSSGVDSFQVADSQGDVTVLQRDVSVELVESHEVTVLTPPQCDSRAPARDNDAFTSAATQHVDRYLQSLRTPQRKRTRTSSDDSSSAEGATASAVDSDDDGSSVRVTRIDGGWGPVGDESTKEESSTENEYSDGLVDSATPVESDSDEFLWHPNTQIGPPHASQEETFPCLRTTATEDNVPASLQASAAIRHLTEPPAAASSAAGTLNATKLTDLSFPLRDASKAAAAASASGRGSATHGSGKGNSTVAAQPLPFELLELAQLFDCFGIAFVMSPAEADAQCAFLASEGLVDAVFTEDSDVVVHGAPTVLRGFFATNKYVVEYQCSDLAVCGLDKRALVALAYLLGCDYTEGVPGLGLAGAIDAVTAAWPSGMEDHSSSPMSAEESVRFVCQLLARWDALVHRPPGTYAAAVDDHVTLLQAEVFQRYASRWQTLQVPESFPDAEVGASFFHPKINDDRTPFPPTSPDWQRVRAFAGGHGLMSSSWLVQRFELARKEWTTKHEATVRHTDVLDDQGRRQRQLTDYGVQTVRSEKYAFKKVPPQQASALAQLRAVRGLAKL